MVKVWKDKEGKKITAKEFGQRFKDGINNITPVQKLKNEVRSTFTMLIGYLVGLVSLIIYREAFVVQWFTYALIIIFLGASWSNGIKWFAMRHQLKLMKKMDMESIDFSKIFGAMEKEKEVKIEGKEKIGMSSVAIDVEKYVEEEGGKI